MRTLIENGIVVTIDATDRMVDPGWVEVVDGVITSVSASPIDLAGADRRIDASGRVVIQNSSTHTPICSKR